MNEGKIIGVKQFKSKKGNLCTMATIAYKDSKDIEQMGEKATTLFVGEEILDKMPANQLVGKRVKIGGRYGRGSNGEAVWYDKIESFIM